LYAFFSAWNERDEEASRLKEELAPKLEIASVPTGRTSAEHRRIVVHNLSNTVIRFGARLEAIEPPIDHAVPVRLQLTNTPLPHLEADIPSYGQHSVDVFVEVPGGHRNLGLLLATDYCVTTNIPFYIPRQRYMIRISAFSIGTSGAAAHRSFHIIPQLDDSIIFSDAG
jgi:hypothetical protein